MTEPAPKSTNTPYKVLDLISFAQDDPGYVKPRGSDSPRRCRFCLKTPPAVKFSKEAHIIPQAFGNRAHTSLEECDECNQRASILENDLAVHLSLQRALARSRTGKKGGVKLKPKGDHGASFVESKAGDNLVKVNIDPSDASVRLQEVADGAIEIIAQRGRHSLVNVSKALARMGYFLLKEEDLPAFDHIRRWINGESERFPVIFYKGFVPGAGLKMTSLVAYRRMTDDDRLPPLMMHFLFSTSMLIFHYPNVANTTSVHALPEDEMFANVQFQQVTAIAEGQVPASEESLLINYREKS